MGIVSFLKRTDAFEKWKGEVKTAFEIEIKSSDGTNYHARGDFSNILYFEDYLKQDFPENPVLSVKHMKTAKQTQSEYLISQKQDEFEDISVEKHRKKHFRELSQWKIGLTTVLFMTGNITDCIVDCIVSSSNEKMHPIAGVAKAIASSAGDKYIEACKTSINQFKVLKVGECRVTEPGALGCKKIFHAYLKPTTTCLLDNVKEVVKMCLETADAYGFETIAMPTFGTGNLSSLLLKCVHTCQDTVLYVRRFKIHVKGVLITFSCSSRYSSSLDY